MAGIQFVDVGVIVVYMASMVGIGAHFAKRQDSASEYLLANRSVGWFAIGLSLLASLNSAADYVIGPAMILEFGFMNLLWILPVFLSFPIIFSYFLPFYGRLRVYNCYEYLEHRFDLGVRLIVTSLFIIWRITWMGATIYLPAYVLNVVMGFDLYWTILVLGAVTTLYTAMGGVRGAIWTDVSQAVIMFAGLILATWLVIQEIPGGFGEVWNISRDEGFMYFTAKIPEMASARTFAEKAAAYFSAPLTLWSILIVGTLSKLTSYGADQVMVQRYLASRSMEDSRRGFAINTVAYIIYSVLFVILGMALFAYFKLNPLPAGTTHEYMFPYFIGHSMPVIMKGLVIAAIYAAAQSSVSSGVTAATSAVYTDFYIRLAYGHIDANQQDARLTEAQKVWFARISALALGICVTLFACAFKELAQDSGLFAAFRKVVGIFEGLLIPIFLLGMFSKRVGTVGVYAGAACGFAASYYWGFHTSFGFSWNTAVAFAVTILVAHVVSTFTPGPSPAKREWLWKEIMNRPLVPEAEETG
ncbi:MAG: sodium/solute symporter [Candidatus Hydrogenedentes bacterium]|nr:sodium/solute symporter [Candidatus Hydrogenedentota bacterium]